MKNNILSVLKIKGNKFNVHHNILVTYANPHSYKIIRKQLNLLENFDIITIDGFSLLKLLNYFKIGQHSLGSLDIIAPQVFAIASKKNMSIYFIGTEKEIIKKSVSIIKKKYPKLNVINFRHGYFKNNIEREKTMQQIINENPDIIMCGMGTPLQEKFLIDIRKLGWNGFGITCGGYLHQVTDNFEYFPEWARKNNLKWLYRMIKEPKVNIKRNTVGFIQFIFIFFYDLVKFKLNKK